MTNQAKWIWYYGDYEIFHGNLLNSRREEKGDSYPPFIALPSIHANVGFEKRYNLDRNTGFHVVANGQAQVRIDGAVQHAEGFVYAVPEGEHVITVYVCNVFGLPAVIADRSQIDFRFYFKRIEHFAFPLFGNRFSARRSVQFPAAI